MHVYLVCLAVRGCILRKVYSALHGDLSKYIHIDEAEPFCFRLTVFFLFPLLFSPSCSPLSHVSLAFGTRLVLSCLVAFFLLFIALTTRQEKSRNRLVRENDRPLPARYQVVSCFPLLITLVFLIRAP